MNARGPQDDPPELTIIVISYNTRDLTLEALRTLHATTRETRFETVVLDNASVDGSADAIAAAFPQVQLIRSPENLGFAAANNRVAVEARSEWLLLLNPDTEVHEGAVDNLMDFGHTNPRGGIYGGRTVFPDGSLNIASCWMRITPWSVFCSTVGLTAMFPRTSLFHPEAMGSWKRDSVRHVDIVVGCFLLIRRALWNELGGFNPRYFMYGEESDLCLRAARLGHRPMVTPEAEIMHIVGAATASSSAKRVLVAKARTTLIRDHWRPWLVPFGVGLMWLWVGLRRTAAGLGMRRRAGTDWAEVWRARHDWLRGY